ncbi:MAG: rRNA pseudouridine synthase [Clostridia bacterium]|nr:rRNA pseudouridine synthase [Clostridia bacterium]
MRINKYIASSGVCSRRKAEEYILEGKVLINGVVNTELGYKVKDGDVVVVDGKQISLEENKVYIMLNKPKGYVTTSKEQFGRPSVLDIVKVEERVYPVGRLDMDSEGLLILTNDGDFSNNIIHPTKHITKKYEVVLKENITETAIKKLENGVDIGGYVTRPAKVEKVSDKKILITIGEGKNRQVRRMIEVVDNKVLNLKRIAIGGLKLDKLKSGEYIMLDKKLISKIFE